MFVPYVPRIQPPRSSGVMPASGNAIQVGSVLHPMARVCDLLTIPGSNTRDFFLYHPFDGSPERLLVSATPDPVTFTTPLKVQIVQLDRGVESITSTEATLETLGLEPREIDVPSRLGGGPVFLRASTTAIDAQLLVTLHIRTDEIQ